jgi:threonine synthase
MQAFDGVVEETSEDELADAVARADRTGTYCCPHTGVALAATEKLVRDSVIAHDAQVVVVSTAHGLKFTEFKLAYHESRLPSAPSRHGNTPIELPAELDAVRRALDTQFSS